MNESLMFGQVYVNDEGRLTCNESTCRCEDGVIDMPGRRMTLSELIEAIEDHWREFYN